MANRVEPSFINEENAARLARWLWGKTGVPFTVYRLPYRNVVFSDEYPYVVKRVVDNRLLNTFQLAPERGWEYLYRIGDLKTETQPVSHVEDIAFSAYKYWLERNPLDQSSGSTTE